MDTHSIRQQEERLDAVTMQLSGVSKHYGGEAALTDVSLVIRPGEVHALLGENGAGKSTLMGVASGTVQPDTGTISFEGDLQLHLTPGGASELGIAIVHQHPALLPDMSVRENLRLSVPPEYVRASGPEEVSMRAMLDDVGLDAHLNDRVESLTIAQKHLLEVAKALAASPKLLILDEPTAPLGAESVELLFDHVRAAAARGTAVVYITHRLAEVRVLADHVTVLRDGEVTGSARVESVSDDQILAWIVGRQLESTFPSKRSSDLPSGPHLEIAGLSGDGFTDISMTAMRGEIVGVAGVVGNGQTQLLAALAGLLPFRGTVTLDGSPYGSKDLRTDAAYMPADRHKDGLMMSLTVRENAAVSALDQFKSGLVVNRGAEVAAVQAEMDELAIRAPSMEADVTSLSGGNQQKVVMARALLSKPTMLIADEPTQGVDVGARSEIYRLLREISEQGIPVVVASSDATELEGLCDRVIVLSRGHSVVELTGDEVTEENIVHAAVSATTHTVEQQGFIEAKPSSRLRRLIASDHAPAVILAVVIVALAIYIYTRNDRYISAFNINAMLMAVAALGFIALGQTVALLIAGIDLSVGPLAGFLVVVGSFFLNDGKSAGFMFLGFIAMFVAAVITGAVNGALIRFGNFTAVAATLAVFIALQGLSFVLRSSPGGLIASSVTDVIKWRWGPVPLVFIALVLAAIGMEYALRRRQWGLRLRAVGSSEEAARRLGVPIDRTAIRAYVVVAIFVFLGAIVLLAQLGIGDPAQGVGFTLSTITAAVLGGTSLLGGRGSFIGTLFGSILIVQVLNATVFLGLDQTWQYFFQGALIMAAALVYSQVRHSQGRAGELTG